jgi:multidrug efflux pump subunit AcrB
VVAENGGEALATGIFTSIEGNNIRTRVFLRPPEERPISTTRFTDLWREATPRVPGATSTRFESDRGGPGGGPAITVEVSHPDIATLERAAVALGNRLRAIPNVSDVDDGFNLGKEQLNFQLTTEGRSLGLTANEVARQVRHAFYGAEAIRQMRGQNEVKVLVRMEENQRRSEYDIEQLMIRTPGGASVPLRRIASVERGRAFTSIERRDGRRILSVTGHCTPREKANQIIETIKADIMPALQSDFPGLSYTFEGRQAEMRDAMSALGKNYLYALFGIYFLLAIPFRSYIQPFIVMVAIPFGIVGAVWGHLMMGYSLSVISVMGIIALSGVVINDALVMVDYANERVRAGHGAFRAMLEAGIRRFRPILLTTLTTFGGLAPMIFETSRQARFMIPMAISLGYGLLFATAITLVIVPSLYLINEDLTKFFKKTFGNESDDPELGKDSEDKEADVPFPLNSRSEVQR